MQREIGRNLVRSLEGLAEMRRGERSEWSGCVHKADLRAGSAHLRHPGPSRRRLRQQRVDVDGGSAYGRASSRQRVGGSVGARVDAWQNPSTAASPLSGDSPDSSALESQPCQRWTGRSWCCRRSSSTSVDGCSLYFCTLRRERRIWHGSSSRAPAAFTFPARKSSTSF